MPGCDIEIVFEPSDVLSEKFKRLAVTIRQTEGVELVSQYRGVVREFAEG